MAIMGPNPYVVGQWVRGERFYGRGALIEEALAGNRDCLWVCGTRRIGKTSLLKQLEWTAQRSPERGYVPIFWDLQGSADGEELWRSFEEAVLDAEELLGERGIRLEEVEADNLFDSISRLRRQVGTIGQKLLLLCDEVEELVALNRNDPALLRKLRRALQSKEDIRTVMASTIRLWALADSGGETSPFLHGFAPPTYIRRMGEEEARALLSQLQAPDSKRPSIDPDVVESIRRECDNHPYLMQLVAKRYLEQQDLPAAIESVATDEMVSYFFSVDYEMLSPGEKNVLCSIAADPAADIDEIARRMSIEQSEMTAHLQRLERLGYLKMSDRRCYEVPNCFFQRWLRELSSPRDAGATHLPTMAESPSLESDRFDTRYRLVAELGRGATGVVYRAIDEVVGGPIAIKIIKREYGGHPDALQRLRQEITLARDLGHPNILRIYHLGECQGLYYITMQLIEGGTLADLMDRSGPLPISSVVEIARKLASALEAAHSKRILHRDIKPQNILLGEPRQSGGVPEPYLTDFGLARLVDSAGLTESGVFVGTPAYASPEQADMRPLDERSDIYSLGTVLYHMAAGKNPFSADDARHALQLHRTKAPPAPRSIRPELPEALERIILRCLEKDPTRRFQTAGELRVALASL